MKNIKRTNHSESDPDLNLAKNTSESGENSSNDSDSEPVQNIQKDAKSSTTSTKSSGTSDNTSDNESDNKSANDKSSDSDQKESTSEDESEQSSENSDSESYESEEQNEYSSEEEATEEDDPTIYQYSKEHGLIRRSTRQRKQTRFSSDSDSDSPIRTRSMTRSKKNAKNKSKRNQKGKKHNNSRIVQKKKTPSNSRSRRGMLTRMSLRQNIKKTRFSSSEDEYSEASSYSESESSIEETETETEESTQEEEEKEEVVQYIMGQKDVFTEHVVTDNTESDAADDSIEYYVKFAGKAYIHCRWMKADEIVALKGGENALRRWNNRSKGVELEHSLSFPSLLTIDEGDANSLWLEVDRIIDEAGDGDHRKYHVKWKDLNYDEATWEKACDVPEEKIRQFHERLDRSNPIKIPSRYKRPSPDSFEEIKEPITTPDGQLTLRPYQMEGFNWLRSRWYNNLNSILADEMGLGKTVQVVCALNDLALHEGISGPFLIVAPLSTLPHWKMEFERWTNLNVVVYHGNSISRDLIRQTEFVVVDEEGQIVKSAVQFDVLITNYETVLTDFNIFSRIEWRYFVLDEAHKLKNSKGKLYQKMETLAFEYCVMLTGTPIQNKIDELWSLLHFLFPSKFDDLEGFKEKYENPTSSKQVEEIQAIINPIILRRKKSDVEKAILPKEETIIDVELSRQQKAFYKALLNSNSGIFLNRIGGGALPALQNLMMQLRKVCNHPYLIKGAEQIIIKEKKEQYKGEKSLEEIELLALIESSGKMILIDKLLPKLRADHHKVLIFSQMVRVLDIIQDYLELKGYPNERIDGSKSDRERQNSIDKFNEDENAFVFLLSTRAGGVGINLTTADTVIIYDSDWNPQNDIQAEARCHRIGQKSKVKVYRLITKDTYESKMFETASKKLGLDHAILDGDFENSDGKSSKMKAKEIEEILRNGVHNLFKEDDNEIDNFSSADIDQILERRAKSIIEDVVTGGGSVFAHAKFNISNENENQNENENGENKQSDAKDFWKDYLEANQNQYNDHLMIRRCRKNQLEKSTSFETYAIRKAISNLINRGYQGENNELEIIKYASKSTDFVEEYHTKLFESVFGKIEDEDSNDDEAGNDDNENDLIYSANLLSRSESGGFTPSSSMSFSNLDEDKFKIDKINADSESAYIIEEKAGQIIERVLFFIRIKRCLMFIQQENNFTWPVITPSWKGPDADYALLLAYGKYGRHNFLESIYKDQEINETIQLKVDKEGNPIQTKILNSKTILRRISQMVDEIEKQIPMEFFKMTENAIMASSTFPIDCRKEVKENEYLFTPMPPAVWKERHANIMSRMNLEDFEVNELTSALIAYGLPREFHKKDEADSQQPPDFFDDSNENKDFKNVDWKRLKDLAGLPFVNVKAIESTAIKIVTMSEEKEPDMTQLPMLTEYKLKRVKTSVHDMDKIYSFANRFSNNTKTITEMIKKLDKFNGIEWWNYKCDIALINSVVKYGLLKYSIWMIDQHLPFYIHIPSEFLESFANAASSEKKKLVRVTLNCENLPEDISSLKEKARIDRIKFVIKSVNKMWDLKKKQSRLKEAISSNINANADPSSINKNTFFNNLLLKASSNPNNSIQLLIKPNQTPESIAINDLDLISKNITIKISKNIELIKIGSLVEPFDKHYDGKTCPFPVGYMIKRDFKRKEWPRKRYFTAEIEKGEKGPLFKVSIVDEKEPISFTGPNAQTPWKLAFDYIDQKLSEMAAKNASNGNNQQAGDNSNPNPNNDNNNENKEDKKTSNNNNTQGITLFGLLNSRVKEMFKRLPNSKLYPSLKKSMEKDKFEPANFHIKIPKVSLPDYVDNI